MSGPVVVLVEGESDRAALEVLGFFACEADLEEELIRALGIERVERVIESQGELGSFRTFQRQQGGDGPRHGGRAGP